MINIGTYLKIADNSGGVLAKCIGVSQISKRTGAMPGHIITVVVKKNIFKKHVIKKSKVIVKGMICKALLLRNKRGLRRWGHFYVRCQNSMVILLNSFFVPYGTRIFGTLFRELRLDYRFKKLISLAKYSV
jgi:large subunit ribosomal protein L14